MTQEIFQRMDRLAFEALRPSDVLTEMTQQQFEEIMKQRTVLYDAECLYEDQDLIDLVLQFVNATRGEWSPQNLRAEWDSFTGIATIEFDFRGDHVTWTFHQESDWVDIDFYAQLGAFTQHFLSGDFVNMSRNDQFSEYLYLPRSIVAETAFLARLAKEPSLDHNLFIRVFEVLQQYGLLAEVTLQQQVCAWDSFSLLRELLPGRCIEDVSGRISKTENLGERYEYLIDALAEITAGEWAPTQTHSSFEKGKKQVTIGFDFREEHFTWTFEQHSNTIEETFYTSLETFTEGYLSGDFVILPCGKEQILLLYLPRSVAEDIAPILASNRTTIVSDNRAQRQHRKLKTKLELRLLVLQLVWSRRILKWLGHEE